MSKQAIAAVALALALGAGGGYWYAARMHPATDPTSATEHVSHAAGAAEPAGAGEREVLFYRNPMNPAVTSPVPAKDSMGMDYIPVYADEGEADAPAGTVKIDPELVQSIGVRTAVAERRALGHTLHTVGRVAVDETREARLSPKIEGWVEELRVEKTGEPVGRDQILLEVYSPQLVATQQEYVLALKNAETLAASPFRDIREGAEEMVRSARARLDLLDVPEHQLRELEQTRRVKKSLHIHSPARGIVMRIGVREGQYITPKDELYMIADLSKVWVLVDIYENELPWVRVGDAAEMRVRGVPGKAFTGTVTYVYPYLDRKTRTAEVRLEFDNPELLLKPDMFANVTVHAGRRAEAVVVPSEAIVRSGPREQVFVVREPGRFEPREVETGVSAEGMTQVLEGVEAGERVVTSGQFLVDSESKLREATAKMRRAEPAAPPTTPPSADPDLDMSDMTMEDLTSHAGHAGGDSSRGHDGHEEASR